MSRCLYHSSIREFLICNSEELLGKMVSAYHGNLPTTSRDAWEGEIVIMQTTLQPWADEFGEIIFEYDIPRLGKRVDVVLLLRGIIFCLEFKVGESQMLQNDIEQVLDYALDLKNFHKLSWDRTIVPILVPTRYSSSSNEFFPSVYDDDIYNPLVVGADGLKSLISKVLVHAKAYVPDYSLGADWIISPYAPTPTIVEAARTLYENHSVEDITRHDGDTDATISYILEVIGRSRKNSEKSICFVTGVPGAGKTLVGLDIAVKQSYQGGKDIVEDEKAVYLSGNGPLVAVLTEALALDNYAKCRERGEKKNISDSRREVKEFIQIIHRYRDNMLEKIENPVVGGKLKIDTKKALRQDKAGYSEVEHVAIFDEAQRSWTHKRLADYLKRGGTYGNKLKVPNFPVSEAAFLIWSLDQREDWATIVCLVGGGQEINTGEAGITEWINALNEHFPAWKVYISPKLTEKEYAEGQVNELLKNNPNAVFSESLHLSVSKRSFRAETLSAFVHSLLSFNPDAAGLYAEIKDRYPIVLTRDMGKARAWLRRQARGNQRTGVLVTKTAARFKPLAVNILEQSDENAVHWFLEDKSDVRSSNFLEDAATEIQVQGLELDYSCVLWDADMRCENGRWRYFAFNGKTAWREVSDDTESGTERRKYMLNAYRVLLTRARMGMVICVPAGNPKLTVGGFPEDPTRLPSFYNGTYNYLKSLGLSEI